MTTLDVVRASTFVSEVLGDLSQASSISVPVVGGHSGVTIVPLLSQSSKPLPSDFKTSQLDELVNRIQFGGDEVVKAKDGTGSASMSTSTLNNVNTFMSTCFFFQALSMAYAAFEFTDKIISALNGEKGIIAPSYVNLTLPGGDAIKKEIGEDLEFFSAPVELGVCLHSQYSDY